MTCKDGRFNTGNPICSNKPQDLHDNAMIIDAFTNSDADFVEDRFGVERKTIAGIEKEADEQIQKVNDKLNGIDQEIADKIIAQGGVEIINNWDQASDENVFSAGFVKNGLGYVTPEMFGAVGDGVADDTIPIQLALNTGHTVAFKEPTEYYNITDTLVVRIAGQNIIGTSRKLGLIRNTTNAKRFMIVGDQDSEASPRVLISNLTFRGNTTTEGGIKLPTPNTDGFSNWMDASKNCVIRNIVMEGIGAGWALEVYSWCNTIENFTVFSDSRGVAKTLKGIILSDSANQNNLTNIYLTGCLQTSIQIGGTHPARYNLGNRLDGVVVQQSGGDDGCVVIGNASNTSINSFYSEHNVVKGSPSVIHVLQTAKGTSITNVSHLSGGAVVINNRGFNTIVSNVTSSNVSASVVNNYGYLEVSNVAWLPQITSPTGRLVGTATGASTNWLDRGFGEKWEAEILSKSANVSSAEVTANGFSVSNGVVNFFGRVNISTTAPNLLAEIGISLPITSFFTGAYDCLGVVSVDSSSLATSGAVVGTNTGVREIKIKVVHQSSGVTSYNFMGSYTIK